MAPFSQELEPPPNPGRFNVTHNYGTLGQVWHSAFSWLDGAVDHTYVEIAAGVLIVASIRWLLVEKDRRDKRVARIYGSSALLLVGCLCLWVFYVALTSVGAQRYFSMAHVIFPFFFFFLLAVFQLALLLIEKQRWVVFLLPLFVVYVFNNAMNFNSVASKEYVSSRHSFEAAYRWDKTAVATVESFDCLGAKTAYVFVPQSVWYYPAKTPNGVMNQTIVRALYNYGLIENKKLVLVGTKDRDKVAQELAIARLHSNAVCPASS